MKAVFPFLLKPFAAIATPLVSAEVVANYPLIKVTYRIAGAPQSLGTGTSISPKFNGELWKTNCFELFLRSPDGKSYFEWNFAPDAQSYGFFVFSDYRKRITAEASAQALVGAPRRMQSTVEGDTYEFKAVLDLSISNDIAWRWINRMPIQVHPTVILDRVDAEGSGQGFWAPAHPGGKPDFHDASVYQTLALP